MSKIENIHVGTFHDPRDHAESPQAGGAWQMLSKLLPTADLTEEALAGRLAPAVDRREASFGERTANSPDPYEWISRALYRRQRQHVLITGLKGVGKTRLLWEFARRAADGQFPFLRDARFLWVDCKHVGPEDSRSCLETIVTAASEWPNAVLCLDGIGALLKRPMGGNNQPLLMAAARRPGIRIMGILSKWEFNDLISSDAELLDLFTPWEVQEPTEDAALTIVESAARELEQEFHVTIDQAVVQKSVTLTSSYMLNERLPAKAIRVLEHLCEDAEFYRTQHSQNSAALTTSDVIRVVSERTGIPQETLAGKTGSADFESALSAEVVGQDEAVKAMATKLRLIKAGLTDPGKPASVLLFAGMTGVGKTELAKVVAKLYSTSKRLQTYTMGNFVEPHSVSGIIGVPPGYVGYENGGQLINELNADPYAVFLLDEAEKAHPNVWKPFFNLFDEGWIVDQRGIKAYADRAIFILTTNAGDNTIAQMTRSGKSPEEIVERVKQTLSKVRQERSSQPVFTPQFLSRIERIVVFKSLDEPAMVGISRKLVGQMQRTWHQKREKQIHVSEDLVQHIGRLGHGLNEKSGGQEGGRIIRKLLSDLIETSIQEQATSREAAYKSCRRIHVVYECTDGNSTDSSIDRAQIKVTFEE